MACRDKDKFITSEAATKSAMRTQGAIDRFLNIINLNKFRELNFRWSDDAKRRFGIKERLFFEEDTRAVPNSKAFTEIDNKKGIFYQREEVPISTASIETISKMKEVMKKMGVDLQSLSDYIKGNPDVSTKGATGLADLTRGIIAIAEGKEDVALTEEMVHVATSILEQTNPSLVTEMISKIGNFKIYTQVLNAYKNNPSYQLSNGKPDIRKIKKEAVDKLIAELIIRQSEGSTEFPELLEETIRSTVRIWWQKILT